MINRIIIVTSSSRNRLQFCRGRPRLARDPRL